MKKVFRTGALIGSLATAGLLAACGGGGSAGGTGTLSVALTDAPACGFDAVNVTVNKVRVHQSGSADTGAAGWSEIVLSPAKKINLLDLTNGVLADLGDVELPAGRYTQVRLVLDPNTGSSTANSVIPTGSTTEIALTTPSAVQSGIKLINDFEVTADKVTPLVLDFDACKSVVTKGSGGYSLKPVIKIVPAELNGIEGYVNKAQLADHVTVTAQQAGVIVGATVPDPASGRFLLSHLPTGNYDVVISADNRATTVVSAVPVASATGTVALSTSTAPIDLAAGANPRTISGTVTLNPAGGADDVAYVAARQSFAAGPTVTVKYRGAAVPGGAYTLDNLPSVAPMLGQYSTTLPITFAAQTDTTPGTGKYSVVFSADGYQSKTTTVDVGTADAVEDATLTK